MIAENASSSFDRAVTFAVPLAEMDEFHRLPLVVQREVNATLGVLARMAAVPPGKRFGVAMQFHRAMCSARGTHPKSLNRKWNDFIESGHDWRVLVDEAKLTKSRETHPPEFIEHWLGLYESNQRTCPGAAAHRLLRREWQVEGKAVPGYGTWQEYWQRTYPDQPLPVDRATKAVTCPAEFLPPGWDYATLIKHKPKPAEKALAQLGLVAAQDELAKIPTTRKGLRFLEWIVIDDVRTDFLICVDEFDMPVEFRCVLGLDLATAMPLRFGGRPAVPRADGSVHGIVRLDTLTLLLGILQTYGFPLDYKMNVILEEGTATISREKAAAITQATGGQVVFHWTSIKRGAAKLGGFTDRSLGNPTGKAWLESFFNFFHNELGFEPGQIGPTYQRRPAEIEGRSKELKSLVEAGRYVSPELRLQLRAPFHNMRQARVAIEDLLNRQKNRHEHSYEDFERVRMWRWRTNDPHQPPRPMSEYPVGLPPGAEQSIELLPPRNETPLERWHRLVQGHRFEKICEAAIHVCLEKHQSFVTVDGGLITLKIDGRAYRFYERGSPLLAKEGAKYFAHYSRADLEEAGDLPDEVARLDCIYLTDGRDAYLGRLPLDRRIKLGDAEALARRIKDKQHELNVVRKTVSSRPANIERMKQREADLDHNIEVFERADAITVAPVPAGTLPAQPAGRSGVVSDLVTAEAETEAVRTDLDRSVRAARDVNVVKLLSNRYRKETPKDE